MDTFGVFEVRELNLELSTVREKWTHFISENGLRQEDVDYTLGIFDGSDTLIGTASLRGNIIKEVAIAPSARESSLTNTLLSRIISHAFEIGYDNVMIFTKPEYLDTFRSLSFHKIGSAPGVVLLESDPRGLSSYVKYLSDLHREGRNGVVVMNANPMTLGHKWLIEKASSQVDNLYVIPVSDNPRNEFSYGERVDILRRETNRLGNVTICEGSPYVISESTFPSYFLKEKSLAADTHIRLDLDIFASAIVPALQTSVRFAGSEPNDPLTLRYNELMGEILPQRGVEVVIFDRLIQNDQIVSASSVRKMMRSSGGYTQLARQVVPSSIPYIFAHMAADALDAELTLTPKPGLVDRHDRGAHRDMDYYLMKRSIDTLRPWLAGIAVAAFDGADKDEIRQLGLQAEQAMLTSTRGINTHRGALFSMGMMLIAACRLAASGVNITTENLKNAIISEAAGHKQPTGTHGAQARIKYSRGGAIENATSGYSQLFSSWLPYYRGIDGSSELNMQLRALLKIMSELDDSNILYRSGEDVADYVKKRSADILKYVNDPELRGAMQVLNGEFTSRNISPGGAADMFALTIFADRICEFTDRSDQNSEVRTQHLITADSKIEIYIDK